MSVSQFPKKVAKPRSFPASRDYRAVLEAGQRGRLAKRDLARPDRHYGDIEITAHGTWRWEDGRAVLIGKPGR